ncbi:hypothetical protein LZ683_10405 [Comamonas testosteroni]|uniref:hypothetical protein n=1 Tax=Comamonas testosteroni TaxID=285 RepID=UPI0023AAC1D8|nr:hypothetical protein [Comamonas testosteroni]WEE79734.1 hypothetical protein LZ683_10405 [Comamonas testosteroni]
MSIGPQLTLIEIIKLQMKMGEALAATNGRISQIEALLPSVLTPEQMLRFEESTKAATDEHVAITEELRDQIARVVESIERYTNG